MSKKIRNRKAVRKKLDETDVDGSRFEASEQEELLSEMNDKAHLLANRSPDADPVSLGDFVILRDMLVFYLMSEYGKEKRIYDRVNGFIADVASGNIEKVEKEISRVEEQEPELARFLSRLEKIASRQNTVSYS